MSTRRPWSAGAAAVSALSLTAALTTALVAGATGPAAAQQATTNYLCTFPELGDVDVPLTMDVTGVPATMPVGVPVPAGAWPAVATLHLDEMVTAYLIGHTNAVSVTTVGANLLMGPTDVPFDLRSGLEPLPVAEELDVPMSGSTAAFTPKFWAEDLSLETPEAFSLLFRNSAGEVMFTSGCEWDDEAFGVLGKVSVVKQNASLTRKLVKKPVKTTKRAKVQVTVVDQTGAGVPGDVLASLGDRNLALGELADGKVVLKLPKLPAGKHVVTLSYLGSRNVDKASRNIKVKIVSP